MDINSIQYSEPFYDKGIYYSKATINDKPITIKTPKLKIKNDLVSTKSRTFLDLELSSFDIEFYNQICELDEHILVKAYQNSENWFNQEVPIEILDDYHRQTIKKF